MKKILIVCMPFDHGLSGISVYIKEIASRLAEKMEETQIDLMLLKKDREFFPSNKKNVRHILYSSVIGGPIRNLIFHLIYLPIKLQFRKWFLSKEKQYDAVLLPAANRRVCAFYPYYTVATIHDFSPLRLPGKYDKFRTFYAKHVIPFFLRNANTVLAVSRSTLVDVMHLTGLPYSRVGVCYPGCKTDHFPALNLAEGKARKEVKGQWGINKKFILFVSRIEHPGKNHIGLMKAYGLLSNKNREKYDLVFAGSSWRDSDKVKDFACNSPYCHSIHFLGFVTNDELSLLYKGASLFVFPSFYEGFGFPVLEAMAHGVPVALSNRSSLLELGFSSTVSFDPNSFEDMAKTMAGVLENPKKREVLIRKGLERVSEFSWKASIERLQQYLQLGVDEQVEPPTIVVSNDAKKDVKKTIEEKTLYLERRELFGVSFVNVSLHRVLKLLSEIMHLKAKATIFFLNSNSVNLLQKDIQFKKSLLHADYVFPDGVGIRLACMVSGFSMRHNLNGTDLFPHLLELCQIKKKKVYFLGGKEGVAVEMSELLKQKYPHLKIAGCAKGYFDEKLTGAVVERINASKAEVLLVGMGSPTQEKWIHKHSNMLNAKIVLGVGGLFDFYSGKKKRAPRYMRKMGLEWLFRLNEEPLRLWQRYLLGNIIFLVKLPLLFFSKNEVPSFFEDKGNE